MLKTTFIVLLLLALFCCQSFAQEICLKESFWSGWKYSFDGENYEKVGISAKPLKVLMADNEKCLKKLRTYELGNILGIVFGVPMLALIVVNVIEMTDSDGKDPSKASDIVIYALGGASIGAVSAANYNLKEAVELYNSDQPGFNFEMSLVKKSIGDQRRIQFEFTYEF